MSYGRSRLYPQRTGLQVHPAYIQADEEEEEANERRANSDCSRLFPPLTMTSQAVVFTTRTSYTIPSQTYMLPNSWKRFQLSQLINKVLSLLQPVPFDFLVRGELLRGSIAEWCTERGVGEVNWPVDSLKRVADCVLLSQEETLEIEYIEATIPPQRAATLPHDDWVASISCTQSECA